MFDSRRWLTQSAHHLIMLSQKIRSSTSALVLSLASIVVIGIAGAQEGLAQQKFRVGVLVPLSGALSEYGVAAKNGFEIARQESPELFKNVDFVFDDTQYDSKKAISGLQKLRFKDGISAAYVWGYGPNQAVSPIIEKQQFPLFAVSSEQAISASKKYTTRFCYHMGSMAEVLIEYLRAKNAKNVGIVKGELAFFNGLIEELEKRLRADESISIVESLQSDESNFKTTVAKLRGRKFDALGVFLVSGQISQFYREMRQFSLRVDTIGTDLFDSMNEVKQSQGAMVGAVFAAPWIDTSFIETYRKRYGNDVQAAWAANAYEFAKLTGRLFGNEHQKLPADEIIKRYTSNRDEQGSSSRFKYEESADGSGFNFKAVARRVEADRIVNVTQ